MKVMPGKRNAVIAMTAVFVLLTIMLCAGAVCPETAQGDKGRYGDVLSFSAAPGFYAEPFYLSIDAPADEIYYTLDGTDPDRDSIRYTGPIYIYDVSSEPNVYCEIKDVSPFYDDELKELFYGYRLNDDIEYPVPDYKMPEQNIDKCTVIKAVWYDKTGNKSDVLAGSYFVGKEEYTRDDLVTISLFTDPASFFDHRSGIYVLGDRAEEYFEEISEAEDEEYREELLGDLWEANYTGRGREWERQATLQVFNNGGLELTQQTGVRIQGGYSREYCPKSLNLYAREEMDGNKLISLDAVDMTVDKMTLYNGGEDIYSKLKDPLMAGLCSDMDFTTMRFIPCELYLNGEYWGFYYLTEKYDKKYIEKKYNVDDDNVVIIKNNEPEEGFEEDLKGYLEDMDFISGADMTDEANYQKACRLMDMDGFIDYMAAEIYIARWLDWPGSNFAMWKSRTAENGEYGDRRWRMLLFDVNWGGMSYDDGDAVRDSIAWVRRYSPIFDNLCHSDVFRSAFADRLMSFRDSEFAPEHVSEEIDGLSGAAEEPMKRHYMRFFGTDDARFYEEAEKLKLFFRERYDYIPVMIEDNFGE